MTETTKDPGGDLDRQISEYCEQIRTDGALISAYCKLIRVQCELIRANCELIRTHLERIVAAPESSAKKAARRARTAAATLSTLALLLAATAGVVAQRELGILPHHPTAPLALIPLPAPAPSHEAPADPTIPWPSPDAAALSHLLPDETIILPPVSVDPDELTSPHRPESRQPGEEGNTPGSSYLPLELP